MPDDRPATRLMVFLTEDDRVHHRSTAEELLERARARGVAGATIWRGMEGFGPSRHVRASRLPDLARGLPLILELIDDDATISDFVEVVREVAPGCLMTLELVRVCAPRQSA